MSRVYKNLTDLIGNTPLLELGNYAKKEGINASIIGKLEYFNPLSSVKDRIAFAMIEDAEKSGKLTKATTIIEPTSGNTGIGLAFVSAARGYKLILTMPESMSIERRKLLKSLGAELILTPAAGGMKGAIDKANELNKEIKDSIVLQQFENPANPAIHKKTTALEIINDIDGDIDFFVSGIGTGGTISGVGEVLKEKYPNIKVIAVEPEDSPVLSQGKAGPHKIQGIGAGFKPLTLNDKIYDEIITISNDDSFAESRKVALSEGLLVGISSGAALKAAKIIAQRPENKGKKIVVILPDTGERYLSTALFED